MHAKYASPALLLSFFVLAGCATVEPTEEPAFIEAEVSRIGEVAHPPAGEMSGLTKSQMYDELWWTHNDHGNEARLFGLNGDGEVVIPPWQEGDYFVGEPVEDKAPWPGVWVDVAANIDWEAIAVHEGRLYIGDIGNNGNARRDLGIYVVPEPNARATDETRPLKHIPLAYPDQTAFPATPRWRYDAESLFIIDGRLHLLTRHRRGQQIDEVAAGTNLYRLDNERTEEVNVLTHLDSHPSIGIAPTGAEVSPDGEILAVLTMSHVWLFQRPAFGDRWLSGETRRIKLPRARMKQAEAICWDGPNTLRITNEDREVFRVSLAEDWRDAAGLGSNATSGRSLECPSRGGRRFVMIRRRWMGLRQVSGNRRGPLADARGSCWDAVALLRC